MSFKKPPIGIKSAKQNTGLYGKKNLFCLISPETFSSTNMLANMMKNSGVVTMLGQTSRGGSGMKTPESFTKAFSRFHGVTPSQVRAGAVIRTFLPLTIKLSIQGGNQMDYKITPMFPFKVIGFQKVFDNETAYAEIPKYWDEICEKYAYNVYAGNAPANPYEQALVDNCIGEYGICIDDIGDGKFRYLIAGKYTGGEVPEGMVVYEFPRGEWAIFNCIGPIPEALQSVNTRIFQEWLPGNPEFELCGNANVEWYDCVNGEKTDPDYHSAIWVPVKRKTGEEI